MATVKYDLENSMGFLLNRTTRAAMNALNRNFQESGLDITGEQWMLLVNLWNEEGKNQQELAQLIGKDKTSLSRLIDGLEKRKLVHRVTHEKDRRDKLIYLTKEGKDLQKKMVKQATVAIQLAENGITVKQLDICKDVLKKIYLNLNGNSH